MTRKIKKRDWLLVATPKSLEEDTALFEDIVRGMTLVERLDRIKESLDV